ncbi:MAG: U32 family peptidase, partial [Desulfobulbaceae bacterium]|nr:U32 family peptidase [Desulfobulbaceae bacterium]
MKTLITDKHAGRPMELLAPAGSIEAFEAAVAAGADAVYIGAPTLNARALAKHFGMAEIAAMVDHAHQHEVKVYVAMNSLMKEEEIPAATHALAAFEHLGVDAVIMQDLGLYHLARRHFPKLRLHASTLLAGHNSAAVRQFVKMGFQRVVLARELAIPEIAAIHRQNQVELEVFIHGALCFSYSGLCLFSSFQGGKSGLRGRCVQPCRRRYTWSGKGKGGAPSGYLFSMNDLCGIDLIPQLREAGVTSLKIEGRMRSARYVEAVTAAYRMALDA